MVRMSLIQLKAAVIFAALLSIQGCTTLANSMSKSLLKKTDTSGAQEKINTETCFAKGRSVDQLIADSSKGVTVIETADSTGSGFVIQSRGTKSLILTNSHVLEGSRIAQVKFRDGSIVRGRVVSDAGGGEYWRNDIALLEADKATTNALKLEEQLPGPGSDVYAIGAPEGLEYTVTKGIVSSTRDEGEIIQLDAAINPGNSGGPVINSNGCVVGMATFIKEETEGLNFALSTRPIIKFINSPYKIAVSAQEESPYNSYDEQQESLGNDVLSNVNCWFENPSNADKLLGSICDINLRSENADHTIYELDQSNDSQKVIVLWDSRDVEVVIDGQIFEGKWETDSDDDVLVRLDDMVFAFTPKV